MRRMNFAGLAALAVFSLAVAARADQVVALKNGSYFKVRSYEVKGERLIITDLAGQILGMRLSEVDLERSQALTVVVTKKDAEDEERKAQERAEVAKRAARANKKMLTLVEASRRYGVDRPAVNIAEGAPSEPAATATPAAAAPAAAGGAATDDKKRAKLATAKSDLEDLKKRRDELVTKLNEAKADGNVSPLGASNRQSRIDQLAPEIAAQERRIAEAEKRLRAAQDSKD